MFEHLSNDHSLFYVNDRHLAQFLTLFDSLQHALLEYPIQHDNVAPAIYNFWLLLNSDTHKFITMKSVALHIRHIVTFSIHLLQTRHFSIA